MPTKIRLKGGWNVSTVARILKDEKYIGTFLSNRTMSVKDPLSGRMKQVERPKEEWVIQDRPDIRSITDEEWAAAQVRWREVEGVFPRQKGKKGFEGKRKSYVDSHRSSAVRAVAPSRSSAARGAATTAARMPCGSPARTRC